MPSCIEQNKLGLGFTCCFTNQVISWRPLMVRFQVKPIGKLASWENLPWSPLLKFLLQLFIFFFIINYKLKIKNLANIIVKDSLIHKVFFHLILFNEIISKTTLIITSKN